MKVSVDIGAKLRRLGRLDTTPLMRRIGAFMVSVTVFGFQEQKRGRNRWPPRGVPNILGILSDLDRGRGIPARRFEERPVLEDTGRLRNSITHQVLSKFTVEFGTNVRYASKLQFGSDEEEVEITDEMKEGLAEFLKANPEHRKRLGFLFSRKKYRSSIRARPFIVVTKQDLTDIRKMVREFYGKAGKAAIRTER